MKTRKEMKTRKMKGKEMKELKKKKLTAEEESVLHGCATEAPFSGALLHETRSGKFVCKACGNVLFSSEAKFDSGTGWPSFSDALPGSVSFKTDWSAGIPRVEVRCALCGSHLGHVFDDGPQPTGKRYCMNSCALDFKQAKKSGHKEKTKAMKK